MRISHPNYNSSDDRRPAASHSTVLFHFFHTAFDPFHVFVHLVLRVRPPHLLSSSSSSFLLFFFFAPSEMRGLSLGQERRPHRENLLSSLSFHLSLLYKLIFSRVSHFLNFIFIILFFIAVFGLRAAPNTITIFSRTLGSSLAEAGPGCDVITAGLSLSLSLSLSLTTRRSRTAAP